MQNAGMMLGDFWIQGSGFRIHKNRIQDSGFRIQSEGLGVQFIGTSRRKTPNSG
jgi:hypothetical protein